MAGVAQGGADLVCEGMTLALAASGHEMLPVVRADAARMARLAEAGLRPVELPFGGPFDLATKARLAAALKDFRADIAIAWTSRAAAKLPRGAWTNIGRLGGYDDLKHFRTCDHLVGDTHGIVDWIAAQNKFPRERIKYLPHFVDDLSETDPVPREALGVPEDARLMLGLGRLHDAQGFDVLIRAAALLPEVYCLIAGDGPARQRLQTLIDDLRVADRVRLLGWRNDTGALLKAADIFVSSSRHETLGNMVVSAFAAQTPVLAARAEGVREVIRHGQDGLLVPVDDVAALAAAARSMLNDVRLRVKLALAARQRYAAEFSREVVLNAWLDFLETAKR